MWLRNDEGTVLVNSDNIAYVFIAHYEENIVIRASMPDGGRVTLRKLPVDDEDGALREFEFIQGQLDRDHQRRWGH